ncbi:MAG: DUF6580 family putative transport protein [Patescibacteria group bacterium]|nr:hypothetical protein [Patescibacteria group bacterium]
MKKENKYIILAVVLVVFAVAMRLLPHPPNFTPIAALAIFGALYLPKKWALILPLAAMLVSDAVIGFYSWKILVAVYASFLVAGGLGILARNHKSGSTIFIATILGSILFFLITNAAVWAFGTMYTHDFSGLLASYISAAPFFRATLAGDLFYVGLLAGTMEFVLNYDRLKAKLTKKQIVVT